MIHPTILVATKMPGFLTYTQKAEVALSQKLVPFKAM
jgi:hypothetical protein